jgi:hypothetical protein
MPSPDRDSKGLFLAAARLPAGKVATVPGRLPERSMPGRHSENQWLATVARHPPQSEPECGPRLIAGGFRRWQHEHSYGYFRLAQPVCHVLSQENLTPKISGQFDESCETRILRELRFADSGGFYEPEGMSKDRREFSGGRHREAAERTPGTPGLGCGSPSPRLRAPSRQLLSPGGERVIGVGDARRPLDPLGRFLPCSLGERSLLRELPNGLDELPEIPASLP